MKVLAVGGGSGGHVTPIVAVIEQLAKRDSSLKVRMVVDQKFAIQTKGLMQHAATPVSISVIRAGKFRRYSHLTKLQHFTVPHVVWGNLTDIGNIIIGFIQSIRLLIIDRPNVVFAKGGFVCLPVGIAAWLLHIPLVIHDSDTRPGLTNRVLAWFATSIATGSPLENYPYDPKKSRFIGVPIGKQFTPVDATQQLAWKQALSIPKSHTLVVATGGGLGSQVINHGVLSAAKQMKSENISFFIIAGKRNYHDTKEVAATINNVTAVDFVYEHMEQILGAADIVVTRASATFLQELAGLKKTTIAVPAKQLGDQIKNAKAFGEVNAVCVLTDHQITDENALVPLLHDLIHNETRAAKLAENLHAFARPNAADDLAQLIVAASEHK